MNIAQKTIKLKLILEHSWRETWVKFSINLIVPKPDKSIGIGSNYSTLENFLIIDKDCFD